MGGSIAGIAVTAVFSQRAFAEELGVEFPLLSDWSGEVCAAYGVRYDEWKGHAGLAKRALFVVDRGLTIRFAWSHDHAEVIPDLQPVRSAVRQASGD